MTKRIKMTCYKCDGKGFIEGFGHIENGRCFACGGAGTCLGTPATVNMVVNNIGYTAEVVALAILDGNEQRANHYATLVAQALFKAGNAIALRVLNTLREGQIHDDTEGRVIQNARAGRAAANLIIKIGIEMKKAA